MLIDLFDGATDHLLVFLTDGNLILLDRDLQYYLFVDVSGAKLFVIEVGV
jgi:hypothetical protein